MEPIRLGCPFCKVPLDTSSQGLICPSCGGRFPVLDGIPSFTAGDVFYEGRWVEPDRSAGTLRNWLVRKERFFLRRLAGRRGQLLDLGCGGGWQVFAQVGDTAGVDVSRSSAAAAQALYTVTAAADLRNLPFPDASFDFVVSSDVLGHVSLSDKDLVLSEIIRVLRPGGRTLHYIEADPSDPLNRLARRFPDLYERYIIAPEGHIGLEPPDQIFARFRRHGLRPVTEQGVYRLFMYADRYPQCFANEFMERSRWFRVTVPPARALTGFKFTEMLANLLLSATMEIGDRVLPIDWSSGVLVEYEKD